MSFTPNIPSVGQKLGASRQQVLNNFASLRSTIAVDHIDVNSANAGKHTVVHLQNNVSDPTALNNFGEIYSKGINSIATDIALFYRPGNTGIAPIQMTMNVAPLAATNGYSFLPGGILIQWGTKTSPGSSGQISFPIPFPSTNPPFTIQVTLKRDSGNQSVTVDNGSGSNPAPTASKFGYLASTSGSTAVYWIAIGN